MTSEDHLIKLGFDQLKKLERDIVRLNKERLSGGEDLDGSIYGVYTEGTQEFAQTENPRKPKVAGTAYNFEWTGGLFDGMYLIIEEDYIEVWSKDKKAALLNIEFPGIFGLQDQQLAQLLQQKVYPIFMGELRKQLGL